MNDNLKELVASILQEAVTEYKDSSKGAEQKVSIITVTSGKQFVVKQPHKNEMLFREVMACTVLKNKIPLPSIIYSNDALLIETFIAGNDLSELKLSASEEEKVYARLGEILAVIHSQPTEGYGNIMLNGKGKHDNLKSFSLYGEHTLNKLRKAYLSSGELQRLRQFMESQFHYFNNTQSVLLHYDFIDPNIRVNNGEVSGIIDFGDLSAGCPALDFAWIYIHYYNKKAFDYILKGYAGNIDMDEVRFLQPATLPGL